MEESTAKTIRGLKDWQALRQMRKNVRAKDRMTPGTEKALHARALQLAQDEVETATGLELDGMTPAENQVLNAVKEYLVLKRNAGSNANRTLDQVKKQGLLRAAEISVEKRNPTSGFNELVQADLEELSYENIVVQNPDEFTERTLWFARRTLNLPNASVTPPAPNSGKTQVRTEAILQWLEAVALANEGVFPEFSNADIAASVGLDLQRFGRPLGNIQSRIDFACFQCALPPLGLAVTEPFAEAWRSDSRNWDFPTPAMQAAAQARRWSAEDFRRILAVTRKLPPMAHPLWKAKMAVMEDEVREWAYGLSEEALVSSAPDATPRPPAWSRDELILALDLYMHDRSSPPDKRSPEVLELSAALNRLGQALGTARGDAFRNANGVYMKMMNFRRFDTQFTTDGRVGLTRGNKDEAVVWEEFSADPSRLKAVAAAILLAVDERAAEGGEIVEDEAGVEEAAEGRLLTRVHRTRERSRQLVQERKKKALKEHGRLFCEACGFDFGEHYGEAASHIIECHHTKPVHTLVDGSKTRLDDLALLCANCHRVVHASRKWLSVEELRQRLAVARKVATSKVDAS